MRHSLPNLIVIGAQKCGTTALHSYLRRHPQIAMSSEKELDFFIAEGSWGRGADWYRSQFPADAPIRGESSPNYTAFPRYSGVPQRMHSLVPEAKLILLVRPPIERIVAHYVHAVSAGLEKRAFDEAMRDLDHNPYVIRSRYFAQIEQYLAYYPASRILVVAQDELRLRRIDTLRSVFEFLDVEPAFRSWRFRYQRHRTREKRQHTPLGSIVADRFGDKLLLRLSPAWRRRCERALYLPVSRRVLVPRVSPALRRRLVGVLRDDFARFEAFAGRRFAGWLAAPEALPVSVEPGWQTPLRDAADV